MDNMYSDLPQSLYDACCGDKFDFAIDKTKHVMRFVQFVAVGLLPRPKMQVTYPDFLGD